MCPELTKLIPYNLSSAMDTEQMNQGWLLLPIAVRHPQCK